jgi:hypothetical protein
MIIFYINKDLKAQLLLAAKQLLEPLKTIEFNLFFWVLQGILNYTIAQD